MLGASRIGPFALILPARSHPEVVVTAVASRDARKAAKYAKEHKIAKSYSGLTCYQRKCHKLSGISGQTGLEYRLIS